MLRLDVLRRYSIIFGLHYGSSVEPYASSSPTSASIPGQASPSYLYPRLRSPPPCMLHTATTVSLLYRISQRQPLHAASPPSSRRSRAHSPLGPSVLV